MLKIKLTTATIFSLSLAAHAASISTYSQLRSNLEKTSKKNMVELINEFLKVSHPSRMVGTPGHLKAQEWLVAKIKSYDQKNSGTLIQEKFQPDIEEAKNFYQKDFKEQLIDKKVPTTHPEYQKWFKFTEHMKQKADQLKSEPGVNIIWEKPGLNTQKWLVVTAHYDTISHDVKTTLIDEKNSMPGANYNASGVAVALSLVKILATVDLNYSVQVVFLDWQGIGFLGSYHHAKSLKNSARNVLGVMNLDMLGQDSSYFDKTKKLGNMGVYLRARPDEESWVKKLATHGTRMTKKMDFEIKPNGFENSDNIRFWEQGFLSATYTQNWEEDFNPKFYQTPQDTPETLNHDTLYYGYQYLGGAVLGTLLDITK